MISTLMLLFTSIASYAFVVSRTRDWFAPCGFLCLLWFSAAALADAPMFKNSSLQAPSWSLETYAAIYLSGLSVLLVGVAFSLRRKIGPIVQEPSKLYQEVINILICLSIFAVVFRLFIHGFSVSELIRNFGKVDVKSLTSDGIPFIHYAEVLTPYLALAALFELHASRAIGRKRKVFLVTYIVYAVFCFSLFIAVSRGVLLVFLCGAFFLYAQAGRLTLFRIFLLLCVILVVMSILSIIRLPEGSMVNEFFGHGLIGKIFSPVYTYVAFGFENLNALIVSDHDFSHIYYSLRFLLWPVLKSEYEAGTIHLVQHNTLFFNARTYLYAFYHDLGLVGCMIYPTVIAIGLTTIYNSTNKHPPLVIPLMALQKPIWFAFFGNYFFGELVVFIPLLIMYLLAILYQYRNGFRVPGADETEKIGPCAAPKEP